MIDGVLYVGSIGNNASLYIVGTNPSSAAGPKYCGLIILNTVFLPDGLTSLSTVIISVSPLKLVHSTFSNFGLAALASCHVYNLSLASVHESERKCISLYSSKETHPIASPSFILAYTSDLSLPIYFSVSASVDDSISKSASVLTRTIGLWSF